MDKRKLEQEVAELKMDYINLQGDIEKLESVGQSRQIEKAEERLSNMENRLSELNAQLREFE